MKSLAKIFLVVFGITFCISVIAANIPLAASESIEWTAAGPFARSPLQQTVLLDKARESLAWFLSLPPANQASFPAEDMRRRLTPMEAFQAAMLLQEAGQTDPARGLFRMSVPMNLTPEESFEVLEMLGERRIETLVGSGDTVLQGGLATLRQRSQEFLMQSLTAVEQTVLTDVMGDDASPVAMMTAAGVIVKAGRVILARWLLRRFNEGTLPTPAEAAEIVSRVGTPVLRAILDDARLAPENAKAINVIQEASRAFWQTSEGIEQAIRDLRDPATEREAAKIIWRGNQTSVPALLAELETAEDDDAGRISKLLVTSGKDVRGAIVEAMLRSSSEQGVRRLVAAFLATQPSQSELLPLQAMLFFSRWDGTTRDAIVSLHQDYNGEMPTRDNVLSRLMKRANDYVTHTIPLRSDADGCVAFWHWSEEESRVVMMALDPESAYRLFAIHYAQLAFDVAPDAPESRRLFITTWLERAAYLVGRDNDATAIDTALVSLVSPTTARELESALVAAMDMEQYAAATRLATILAAHGTAESLCFADPGSAVVIRPLVKATTSGDRRLRFAATEAVMCLAPDRPYAGSSYVTSALTWFARGEGEDVVVSASPKQADATRFGEELQSLGYSCITATTCREALLRAADSPDVVLVLVDARCGSPPVTDFARQMRRDLRTHDIPVAIHTTDSRRLATVARTERRTEQTRLERIQSGNLSEMTLAVTYPTPMGERESQKLVRDLVAQRQLTAAEAKRLEKLLTVTGLVNDLWERTGTRPVPGAVRLREATAALVRLSEILDRDFGATSPLYTIEHLEEAIQRALDSPSLIAAALPCAAWCRSAVMQHRLAELTGHATLPLELREKSLAAFTDNIARTGVLLRGEQVTALYDRYNASTAEPKESQLLLSTLLDVIEKSVKTP